MDPATMGAEVVAALVPYLAEAGKAAAKKVGEAGWDQAGRLWTAVRARLTGAAQQEALADLEAQPEDKAVQGAAEMQLRKALAADEAFARELAALLPAAQTEARQFMHVTGDGNDAVQNLGGTVTITRG